VTTEQTNKGNGPTVLQKKDILALFHRSANPFFFSINFGLNKQTDLKKKPSIIFIRVFCLQI